ncbi:unnamed protein product [Caenorhabditis bovis]|uniref:Uncharacterized protein n=1 Tax=Caenorhabditis bovis TaxID=2654633 RepID=A0A8S1EI95_9PELO|nr:unnamed protein product [Caenorhabditis bovis]
METEDSNWRENFDDDISSETWKILEKLFKDVDPEIQKKEDAKYMRELEEIAEEERLTKMGYSIYRFPSNNKHSHANLYPKHLSWNCIQFLVKYKKGVPHDPNSVNAMDYNYKPFFPEKDFSMFTSHYLVIKKLRKESKFARLFVDDDLLPDIDEALESLQKDDDRRRAAARRAAPRQLLRHSAGRKRSFSPRPKDEQQVIFPQNDAVLPRAFSQTDQLESSTQQLTSSEDVAQFVAISQRNDQIEGDLEDNDFEEHEEYHIEHDVIEEALIEDDEADFIPADRPHFNRQPIIDDFDNFDDNSSDEGMGDELEFERREGQAVFEDENDELELF